MPSPSFLARPPVRDRAGLRVPISAGVCLRLSRYPSPRRFGLGLLRPLGSRLWLGLGLWSARQSAGPAAATPPSAPPRPPPSPAALARWARRPSPCTAARRGARRRLGGTRGVYNLVSWGSVCAGSLSVRPPLLPQLTSAPSPLRLPYRPGALPPVARGRTLCATPPQGPRPGMGSPRWAVSSALQRVVCARVRAIHPPSPASSPRPPPSPGAHALRVRGHTLGAAALPGRSSRHHGARRGLVLQVPQRFLCACEHAH